MPEPAKRVSGHGALRSGHADATPSPSGNLGVGLALQTGTGIGLLVDVLALGHPLVPPPSFPDWLLLIRK